MCTASQIGGSMAYQLGALIGGFIITFLVPYLLLRAAGKEGRPVRAAITLRVLAAIVAAFLAIANTIGGGGQINAGAVLAVLAAIGWAVYASLKRE